MNFKILTTRSYLFTVYKLADIWADTVILPGWQFHFHFSTERIQLQAKQNVRENPRKGGKIWAGPRKTQPMSLHTYICLDKIKIICMKWARNWNGMKWMKWGKWSTEWRRHSGFSIFVFFFFSFSICISISFIFIFIFMSQFSCSLISALATLTQKSGANFKTKFNELEML